jgi:hypothetical protein
MKKLLHLLVLALLSAVAPTPCFALASLAQVTKEKAKEMGLEIRAQPSGPDAVWVELELDAKGLLKDYERVDLTFGERDASLVSSTLKEESSKPGHILVRFYADRAHLKQITLRVVAGRGMRVVYDIQVKDFVDLEKLR